MASAKSEPAGIGKLRRRMRNRHGMQQVRQTELRRLGRRGGVKRMRHEVLDEMRDKLEAFLRSVLRDSLAFTEAQKRKTITVMDISLSLRKHGCFLYGASEIKY